MLDVSLKASWRCPRPKMILSVREAVNAHRYPMKQLSRVPEGTIVIDLSMQLQAYNSVVDFIEGFLCPSIRVLDVGYSGPLS